MKFYEIKNREESSGIEKESPYLHGLNFIVDAVEVKVEVVHFFFAGMGSPWFKIDYLKKIQIKNNKDDIYDFN